LRESSAINIADESYSVAMLELNDRKDIPLEAWNSRHSVVAPLERPTAVLPVSEILERLSEKIVSAARLKPDSKKVFPIKTARAK
jgi:hypothetical protein